MKKIERFVVYPLLLAVLALASFLDVDVSRSLFDSTDVFGRIGETIGVFPTIILSVFASALCFRFRDRESKAKNLACGIVFGFGVVAFSAAGGVMLRTYLNRFSGIEFGFPFVFLFTLPFLALGAPWAYLVKKDFSKEAFLSGVFIIALFLLALISYNAIRFFWLRPRYRTLVALYGSGAPGEFRAWWQPQGYWNFGKYAEYVKVHSIDITPFTGNKEFKMDDVASFPSGHTMNSMVLMSLPLLGTFVPKLKTSGVPLRILGYLWAMAVGLSRIVRGAHFLSDVAVSMLLMSVAYDLIYTLLLPKTKKLIESLAA